MKNLFLVLATIVSFQSHAGEIDSQKISAVVDTISKFAQGGSEVIVVKGKNADAMLKELIKKDQLEEAVVVNFPKDEDLPSVDGGNQDVGLITMDQALSMFKGWALDGNGGENGLTEKQENALFKMFLALKYSGAQFGYSGYGGGAVCGVSWPGVLVIDTKAKKIYRFIFVNGNC